MAPLRARQSVSKDRFSAYLGALKSQAYHDSTNSRGAGFHGLQSIAWNPLGTLIATGAADKTIRVWNPEKQNSKHSTELRGHAALIEKVAFNPTRDGELCSVSSDGVVKFWDVRTKAVMNEIKGLGEAFTLAWSPDGESLLVGNKPEQDGFIGGLEVQRTNTYQADVIFVLSPTQPEPISSHKQSGQTNQIAFCNSGQKIFLTTGDGRVKILSYPDFEPVFNTSYEPVTPFTLNGHTSSCISVEMQPTGRFLATGGSDSVIALWDTTDWICQRTLIDMTGPVRSISFSFDGSYIVGGSNEGVGLEIAHTETGEYVHSLKTAGSCPVVAWHPSRYQLAYTDNGSLKILGVDPERPDRR